MENTAKTIWSGKTQRPDVFAYQDYKGFLRAYFHYLKLEDPNFSLRKLALQSELSVGYLPTVLNGRHDLSKKALEKLIPHMKLEPKEIAYFRQLCKINITTPQEERFAALHKLSSFREFSKLNPEQSLVLNYFSKWYYLAIREMTSLPDFRLDPKWIHEKLNFSVPVSEIIKALEFLLENKLIKFKPEGGFESADERIQCEGDIFRFVLTHFHKQCFELAVQAVDNTEKGQRHIISHTTAVTKEKFAEAIQIMQEAREKVAALTNKADKTSGVYHFMFLGFPLTKPGQAGDK